MKRSVAFFALLLVAGCAGFGKEHDETTKWTARQLYIDAKENLDSLNYEKAIKQYERLQARYPFDRFALQAEIDVAYAYYKQNDVEATVAATDRFIKMHPENSNVDYAYYLKGLIHFNQDIGLFGKLANQNQAERDPKAARDSFDAFRELSTRFPNSKYAPDAIARMKYLVNVLAEHEVRVASFYYRRTAFVAATGRARYALENYPQSPAIEEALFILVKSYDALGMIELRDDADRVMRKNFPVSEYLKRGLKDEPWWRFWK
ncbi:MAG: outer membrane protein assembly factor BamD [Betaproteobacteria bacterium]|nr:outer membrane protein assembly factor BamD [Betaproteobacteria bacterium]